MTPEEIIRRCDEQIAISGETASVGFRIPGRWGKTDIRRLWKGGPVKIFWTNPPSTATTAGMGRCEM